MSVLIKFQKMNQEIDFYCVNRVWFNFGFLGVQQLVQLVQHGRCPAVSCCGQSSGRQEEEGRYPPSCSAWKAGAEGETIRAHFDTRHAAFHGTHHMMSLTDCMIDFPSSKKTVIVYIVYRSIPRPMLLSFFRACMCVCAGVCRL